MFGSIVRRPIGVLMIAILFVGLLSWLPTSDGGQSAKEKHKSAGLLPEHGTRITGAVDLIMDGKPSIKSGIEILGIARKTRFRQEGACRRKYDDPECVVTYVPSESTNDATRTALTEGLLLYKLTIEGKAPKHLNLTEGAYYFFIQYLNGRWVGTAVDEKGGVRCATFGVIVREVFTHHPGQDHQVDSRVVTHGIASPEELRLLGPRFSAGSQDWVDVQIGWEPFGAGCWKDIVCVPGT